MKSSLSSSIFFVLFMAFVIYMCSREEHIEGKYNVSIVMNSEIDSTDEASMNTMVFLSSAQIQYEFFSDGQLSATTAIGSVTNTDVQQWSINGDSIFINSQRYKFESVNDGYILRGNNFYLVLEKQ